MNNNLSKSRELAKLSISTALGSALEYYDFALYGIMSALVFDSLFFSGIGQKAAVTASLATYAIGFFVRPLGGVIFGRLGDRVGRKVVLVSTILLMGSASTAIGLLPTYAAAGVAAPALLIALRMLQGLGAGAEQAGAIVMMTEFAPPGRRGLFAALPFLGIQLGTIAAPGVYFLLLARVDQIQDGWLWRVPFLFSVVIVGLALWMRLRIRESPTFLALAQQHQVSSRPLTDLLRCSRRTVLTGIGLRLGESAGSSLYQVLAITYVVKVVGVSGPIGAICLIGAGAVGAVTVVLAGLLSDRFGRVPVYRGFALFQLLVTFPVWWVLSLGDPTATVVAVSVALGVGAWGMFGAQGALLPELFGAARRNIGVSVTREASAVVAGGLAPLIGAGLIAWSGAALGGEVHAWMPIAGYLFLLTLVTVVTTFFTPEARGRDLNVLEDAQWNPRGRMEVAQ